MRFGRILRATLVAFIGTCAVGQAQQCESVIEPVAVRNRFPNREAGPVAWNGTVLGVAKDDHDPLRTDDSIWFALYSETVGQLTEDVKVAEQSRNGALRLLWTGSEFGLFYQTDNLQYFFQRISAAGQPVGAAVDISPTLPEFNLDEMDVVWDSRRQAYAVVRAITQTSNRGVWLILLNPDGSQREQKLIDFSNAVPSAPQISITTGGVIGIVFTQNSGAIHVSRVNLDGNAIPVRVMDGGKEARIGAADNEFIIIAQRQQGPDPTKSELTWARLSDSGTVIRAEDVLLSGRGIDVLPVNIIWNRDRSEWALAYLDARLGIKASPGELMLRRFAKDGTKLSETTFAPDFRLDVLTTNDLFIWTGRSYITPIGIFVSRAQGSDSYLVRHCPLTATIIASRTTAAPLQPIDFRAQVTGGSGPFVYNWNWGDRTPQEGSETEIHPYKRLGTYVVTLTVTDSAGAKSVTTQTIVVVEEPVIEPPVIPRRRSARK